MKSISTVKHLYAYEDGDVITPNMGVSLDAGYGLQQYFNPTTGKVIATSFKEHPATLFPQPYSQRAGAIVQPQTTGQQWYYNNPDSEDAAILTNGSVKSSFSDRFKVGTVTQNGKTFPTLVIIGELATAADHTDKYIYYKSTYNGKAFSCIQKIPISESVGDKYQINISLSGEEGATDVILSNDNDYVIATATLQLGGAPQTGGSFKFQKLVGTIWTDLATVSGYQKVEANKLTVYNFGVDGIELFRCAATINGQTLYDTFQITDEHDPYYIVDNCSTASGAVALDETATFNPVVYDRASGEISTGWSFDYILTNKAGDVITAFDQSKLTYANIYANSSVAVAIHATNNSL